jgi:hypothetical protein
LQIHQRTALRLLRRLALEGYVADPVERDRRR